MEKNVFFNFPWRGSVGHCWQPLPLLAAVDRLTLGTRFSLAEVSLSLQGTLLHYLQDKLVSSASKYKTRFSLDEVSLRPASKPLCCCTFCNIGRGTTVWLRGNAADNIWELHFARFRQIWPGSVWTRWIQNQCTIIGTELVFTLVLKVWRLKTKS